MPQEDPANPVADSAVPPLNMRAVRPGARLPRYMSEQAAGMDLHACPGDSVHSVTLAPGQRALVPTGLAIELPEGYEAQIRPRSGLALKHGVTVLNSPGTIDADYRGEVMILLINHGDAPFVVAEGERIAQMVVARVARLVPRWVESLGETGRGDGGYGHTGK